MFPLEEFKKFLAESPETKYNAASQSKCAIAQFFRAKYDPSAWAHSEKVFIKKNEYSIPSFLSFTDNSRGELMTAGLITEHTTFGSLLQGIEEWEAENA